MESKEEYWERLFKGYERSQLSQEDFCSEQGIPAGTRLALSQDIDWNHGIVIRACFKKRRIISES